ncbi:MAG: GUN4 N-terminal ARM-like repeat domain-containing protein [Leptolyngbya sp.]|nr:GUN4 N-terminal ARM-like repeat domain-containing protein [Leptolyngbya sp.]
MSSFIADNPATAASPSPEDLRAQLQDAPVTKQLPLLPSLMALGEAGQAVLMDFLLSHRDSPTLATGRAYQLLRSLDKAPSIQTFLETHFPQGIYPLPSACQVDYSEIQTHLGRQAFEAADRLTLQKMCALAGPNAVKRKWLYFTEVANFPTIDLQTLDQLWLLYSEGRFGFSRQRELWLGVGKNWEKLWPKIAWKKDNVWTRYPNEFIWDLSAPVGHLPLSNQLRGVRVMEALLVHPAWTADMTP